MRRLYQFAVLTVALGGAGRTAAAQTATQVVTIVVEEVSGLSTATDVWVERHPTGKSADAATDAPATYAFVTNGDEKKITGQLGEGPATGLALDVSLAAPTSGSSVGARTLRRTDAVDLVTGISGVEQRGLAIDYSVMTETAGLPSAEEEKLTVIFTVTGR